MSIVSVIGVDPGLTTGICLLEYDIELSPRPTRATLLQADADSAEWVLGGLLRAYYNTDFIVSTAEKRFASIEEFRPNRGAGGTGKTAGTTQEVVRILKDVLHRFGYKVNVRPPADSKTWATDKRLKAAGVVGKSALHGKSRDAYDAARTALYAARWDAFLPDPLIKAAQ